MMSKLLVFAYYDEAVPFLKIFKPKSHFQLKHIHCLYSEQHQTFFLITGSGSINVSAGLSVFFEKHEYLKKNILCFNIGIAGSYGKDLYEIYYAGKISNYHNGKTFYPDVFIKTKYADLISIEFPANKKIMSVYSNAMFDMEGFAFASALKFFVSNHQIHCIKFISDNDGIIRNTDEMLNAYHQKSNEIIRIIQDIAYQCQKFFSKQYVDEQTIQNVINTLNITQSQKNQLMKAAVFFIQHQKSITDLQQILSEFNINAIETKHHKKQVFQNILKILYNV